MLETGKGLCPLCGVSYRCLDEMLSSPAWEDRHSAWSVIESCPGCREGLPAGRAETIGINRRIRQ